MRHLTPGLTPFLKWAGGKRWFVYRYAPILKLLINGRRVVEPFAGAGAFSLSLAPKKALLNDINPHLMNLYHQIQSGSFILPENIINDRAYYDSLREEFNALITNGAIQSLRAAQLFWTLNRLGFNGLCRFNKKGLYNTPFGRHKKLHSNFDWAHYQNLFQRWDFSCGSYDQLTVNKKDFIFCDPPYDIAWQGYYQNNFPFEKQRALAEWVAKQKAPALIMNHPTERIIELYQNLKFDINYISAPRTLSAQAGSRKKCVEVIATHNFSWKDVTK